MYLFYTGMHTENLDTSLVYSSIDTTCPEILFSLVEQNGVKYDSSLVTLSESGVLLISTLDPAHYGLHPLRLEVRYSGDELHYTRRG